MNVKHFIDDESGAITVDWVVLTASIVGIAIAVLLIIAGGISSAAVHTKSDLESATSVASLIGADNYENLSSMTLMRDEGDHQHYESADGTQYRIEGDQVSVPGQTFTGTLDENGNIIPDEA